jgi:hypothetical protein
MLLMIVRELDSLIFTSADLVIRDLGGKTLGYPR